MEIPTVAFNRSLALTIAGLYAFLLLYRAQVLFRAWMRSRTLVRSGRQVQLSPQAAAALACCRRSLNLKRVEILSSTAVSVPVTAGIVRPVLILPKRLLDEGDLPLLISAMGHEAAHVLRHDCRLNLAYELIALPLWFHPAMSLMMRRIRQTRELRCDEIVTERLLEARIFARSLVQLAGAALASGRPTATMVVGIADADILEERIVTILKHSHAQRRRTVWSPLAVLLPIIPGLAAGAFALGVAIRQPEAAVANNQAGAVSSPAQQSDSAQQPSRPSATATAPGKHSKTSTTPDGQHLSETVTILVVADRTDDQKLGVGVGRGVGHGVSGGASGGVAGGVTEGVEGGAAGKAPGRPQSAKPKPELSDITEGYLIRPIEPAYPQEARANGIQGDVVLAATIAKTGDLENLRVISGHPILQAAALDAVKQWKYDPYRLKAEPIEMETSITFKFRLEPQKP
jgi:protein TonB